MLSEPQRTPYDLNFNLGPIPVRVHPIFWAMGLILGANAGGLGPVVWVAALFISILVHEIGHVLAFRYYGIPAKVVLYSMGGLAIPDSFGRGGQRLKPVENIVISFAGPLAGFLLAWLVLILCKPLGVGLVYNPLYGFIPHWLVRPGGAPLLESFIGGMFFINIFWGLVNLLPIYPLDGGHISEEVLGMVRPRDGAKHAVIVSIIAAGLMCALGLKEQRLYLAVMFGYLAYLNIQRQQRF